MKTIFSSLLLAFSLSAMAQGLLLQAGVEKTVSGNQVATGITLESKKLWGVGIFGQADYAISPTEDSRMLANPFYGVVLQAPLMRSEKIAFLTSLRAGLVNEQFFVLVPSVETRMAIHSRLGLSIGSAIRMGHPSVTGKVYYKFSK